MRTIPRSGDTSSGAEPPRFGASAVVALVVLMVPVFVTLVDSTTVSIAIPAIRADLGISATVAAWILSSSVLAFGVGLIPAGLIGDRVGHAPTLTAGIVLFTFGAVAVGTASSVELLIAFRVVQGFGGAFAWVPVAALLRRGYPLSQRAIVFGVFSAVLSAATAVGPLLGGVVLELGSGPDSWRWVFLATTPLGAIASILAPFVLSRTDAMTETAEHRVSDSARVWTRRPFVGGVLATGFTFAGFTSVVVIVSLIGQELLGLSPLQTAVVLTPFALCSMTGALLGARIDVKFGRSGAVLGAGIVSVGLGGVAALLAVIGVDRVDLAALAALLAVVGLGSGLFIGSNAASTVAAVPAERSGLASGIMGTAQRLGTAGAVFAVVPLTAATAAVPMAVAVAAVAAVLGATCAAIARTTGIDPAEHPRRTP